MNTVSDFDRLQRPDFQPLCRPYQEQAGHTICLPSHTRATENPLRSRYAGGGYYSAAAEAERDPVSLLDANGALNRGQKEIWPPHVTSMTPARTARGSSARGMPEECTHPLQLSRACRSGFVFSCSFLHPLLCALFLLVCFLSPPPRSLPNSEPGPIIQCKSRGS